MLEIGTKAPAIELPDQNGVIHTLEEFKGKIMVDSEFGEGTTFVISLPLIKED